MEVFSKGRPLAFGNGTDFSSFPAAHRVPWWLFLLHAEQCVFFSEDHLQHQVSGSTDWQFCGYAPSRCSLRTTLVTATALPAMWDGNLPVHFQPSLCQNKAADDGLLLLRSLLHLSPQLQHLLSLNFTSPGATKVRRAAWITVSILLDTTCCPPVTLHPCV